MSITYIRLAVGIGLLILELVHVPGVGLMFAGLGAITTSLLISNGVVESLLFQIIAFLLATAAWTALLWKPLQKWRLSKNAAGYSNIVGDNALVAEGGVNKTGGNAIWSGTSMNAKLAEDVATDAIAAGATVKIVAVTGATLIVKP